MDKSVLLYRMINIANCLDDEGMIKEATVIDGIIKKTAALDIPTGIDPDFVDTFQNVCDKYPECKTAFSELDHVLFHSLSAKKLKDWIINGGESRLINFVGVYRQHKGDIVATVKDFEEQGIA